MTPSNKDARAQGHDKGSKARGGHPAQGKSGCSSPEVPGLWKWTINFQGVEISIPVGVRKIVPSLNPQPFFLPIFFLSGVHCL